MSDAAAPSPKKSASKAKKAAPKVAEHPKYGEMVAVAIGALKERSGSSRIAILKYLTANYKISDGANTYLKQALKRGVASGEFKQVKGAGASGSFKLADKPKKAAAKKPAAKKPAAKKPAAKKPAAKKAKKTPKKAAKPAAKVAPKKKTPAKKAKKPVAKKPAAKKVKTPKKKAAAKKGKAKK